MATVEPTLLVLHTPTRLHPPLVTSCSNVLWASFAQSWRFHQSNDKSDSFINVHHHRVQLSCQMSFVDPSLLPPATPCTVTVPLQGSTISRISKTFGSVIEGLDRPEGHGKTDHITLGHTFFCVPGLVHFFSAEGVVVIHAGSCLLAPRTQTSVGLSTRYPDFTSNIKKKPNVQYKNHRTTLGCKNTDS